MQMSRQSVELYFGVYQLSLILIRVDVSAAPN